MEDLGDLFPVLLVGGLLLGEDDHAFVVFQALEEHFDFVAYLDVFVFEFIGRDRAFGLVADIDEDHLGFDFEDSALHDGPLVERAECARDQFR